jgi:hypothetical protein
MADEKEPMQADGSDGVGAEVAEERDPASAGRPDMDTNLGQSGGGAYPNPHNGTEKKAAFTAGKATRAITATVSSARRTSARVTMR